MRRPFTRVAAHAQAAAPCSGYSSSCGCSSCGASYGGCSSCNAGVSGGYTTSSGCSSCTAGGTVLPGPAEMSQPPIGSPITTGPSARVILGSPAAAPNSSGERPQTYGPGSSAPPIAPGAPTEAAPKAGPGDSRSFRPPTNDASHTIDPPRIQGVPPVVNGPQLGPAAPAPRPEGSDLMTARPVPNPGYFELLHRRRQRCPRRRLAFRHRLRACPPTTAAAEQRWHRRHARVRV